ncbi:unnamed protein product [Pieris brassicae]|uniref:Uncharacterized protein n=1 Tax=Pieris brassicae TaxID=7116 RepID=A0A9P0X985_PIEBR|nr:unnamed protein product [Pieris brassicae]
MVGEARATPLPAPAILRQPPAGRTPFCTATVIYEIARCGSEGAPGGGRVASNARALLTAASARVHLRLTA